MAHRHFCELCDEESTLRGYTPDAETCGHDEDHDFGLCQECRFIIVRCEEGLARDFIRVMKLRKRGWQLDNDGGR
jgi:hypothetical protein